MFKKFIVLLVLISTSISVSATSMIPDERRQLQLNSLEAFSADSFLKLQNKNPEENIVYSGLSVYSALSILANASDGKTQKSLLKALGLTSLADTNHFNSYLLKELNKKSEGIKILNKNAIWLDESFVVKKDFINSVTKKLEAKVTNVPFRSNPEEASEIINAWANKVSNGLIKEIINFNSAKNLAALINNAIYFKGRWKKEFNKKLTQSEKFKNHDGSSASVKMMNDQQTLLALNTGALSAIELPFKKDAKMIIALPGRGFAGPLATASTMGIFFDKEFYKNNQSYFRKAKVSLKLPKFDIKVSKNLNETMSKMGLSGLFRRPNFSKMSDHPLLAVSSIKQDAAIQVNEEGAEAVAITSIGITSMSVEVLPTIQFHANRPFMFKIIETKTGVTLFQGIINKF